MPNEGSEHAESEASSYSEEENDESDGPNDS